MANVRRPLYFVLHMDRLDRDIDRVSNLMQGKYKRDMAIENKALLSHNLDLEATLLKLFRISLKAQISALIPSGSKDIFGNEFFGFDRYKFIEVTVSYDYKFYSSIRFLGDRFDKEVRFAIYGMPVLQDPTTLNIVSEIRSLSDSIEDFFSKLQLLITCRPGSWEEDGQLVSDMSAMASGAIGADVVSKIGWYQFVNTYFVPNPIIVPKDSLTKEELEALEKKFGEKLFKLQSELDKEEIDLFGLKSEIARLASQGIEINSSSKAIFFADLDKQIETCSALFSSIFDRFTLGCLIQEALACVRPQLTCKEILRGLTVDNLGDRIALAFPRQPETVKKINDIIKAEREKEKEQLKKQKEAEEHGGKLASITTPGEGGVLSTTDKILDAIETVVDLEAICDLRIPFDLPLIELPNFPTIDLMFDLSLDTNILEALCRALFELITGILRDLLDCSKFDKFIAGLLSGEIADDSGIYGDLARLFTDPASLAEESNVAESFGNRWDNFVNQMTPMMDDLVSFQATGSVGIADKAITFTSIKNGNVGLTGMKELIQSGSFDEIGASVDFTKQEERVVVDVTKLIGFTGAGSEQADSFISEMGFWQLSIDENSFTLNRFSDDRITVISKIANQNPPQTRYEFKNPRSQPIIDNAQENSIDANRPATREQPLQSGQVVREERISGEELFNEIGRLFDSVISLFTPTETINLLSGKASLETLSTILELIRIKHKRLFLFVSTIQKVALMFEMFGKAAGLDSLRDKLLRIAASPRSNRKSISIPCPPFDNINDFRKSLLSRTLPEDQVVKIIEQLNDVGRKRFNDIQDGLVKIRKGLVPRETLLPLLCGTGKNSNGERIPVIEDSLNTTIGLMFEPTRMMFDREIQKYPDAVSVTKEKLVEVPRKATVDGNIPIFNPAASQGNIFSDLPSLLGLSEDQEAEDKQSDRINPEFKRMIDSGFVPTKKTGDGEQDFEPDGNPDRDYIDGEEPVFKKETNKKLGSAFKEGIKFTDDDVDLDLNRKFKLTLKGSLDTQSPISSFTPFKVPSPEWIIEYTEKQRTTFNIRAGGQIHSSIYGFIPFSENYKIQKDEVIVDDNLRQEIADATNSALLPPRQDIFTGLFKTKVLPFIQNKQQFEPFFDQMFEEKFESFVRATIREISSGFSRNRLLKKVPNNSLSTLAPEGMNLGNTKADDLIALNLINFSPIQTEKQRLCNVDPHLLDFDFIEKIVKDRFDKECEEETQNSQERITGLTPRRGPISSAGFVGVVMSLIRVYAVEYILRALFVLDQFKFSKDFTEDDLVIDYITFRMLADIERLGFIKDFEREAFLTYEKLLKDGVIEVYSNKINSCADIDTTSQTVRSEMKALVKFQLVSAMERIGTILGIDKKKEVNLKTVFFEGLDTFETFSDFGEPTEEIQYTSINQRLNDITIPNSGKFILERFIRVTEPNNLFVQEGIARGIIKLEQNSSDYLTGVVSFKNWEEFIAKIIANNNLIGLQNKKIFDTSDPDGSLFEQPWKIGLRLVYIPPEMGPKVTRESLSNSKNKFKIESDSGIPQMAPINPNIIASKKSLYVFDKQEPNTGFLADDTEYFKQYNPIPILEKELEITDFITLGEANKTGIFDKIFEKKYARLLRQQLQTDPQIDLLIDYCLFSKRLLSLFLIHSTMVLNGEQMKFLLEGTKQELKKLFFSLGTLGNYVHKNEFKLKGGNAGEFQRKFNRIGDPAGPSGPDAFYFWTTTPIHILKALAIMTDPNIFWADKIVAAAASGFLAPKLVRVGSTVRIEGTPDIVNATPGIALDNEFKLLNTGEVVKLKSKKDEVGKPFIEHNAVALIEQINDGVVTLKQETYPDGTTGPSIRVGTEFTGVPWDRASNGPASGINLDAFNELLDRRPSAPVYPGEKINIPYGLASLALTPMQVFSTILGPLCRTMYNPFLPLGMEFLKFEPLIYDLPHFQIASADTSLADDVRSDGIDLKGASKIGCEDETEEEE